MNCSTPTLSCWTTHRRPAKLGMISSPRLLQGLRHQQQRRPSQSGAVRPLTSPTLSPAPTLTPAPQVRMYAWFHSLAFAPTCAVRCSILMAASLAAPPCV
ncbi:hypothetical protein VPH35_025482 [Triticum aestivum]